MYKNIINFIKKNNMEFKIPEQFSMRIPNDLKKPLDEESKIIKVTLARLCQSNYVKFNFA